MAHDTLYDLALTASEIEALVDAAERDRRINPTLHRKLKTFLLEKVEDSPAFDIGDEPVGACMDHGTTNLELLEELSKGHFYKHFHDYSQAPLDTLFEDAALGTFDGELDRLRREVNKRLGTYLGETKPFNEAMIRLDTCFDSAVDAINDGPQDMAFTNALIGMATHAVIAIASQDPSPVTLRGKANEVLLNMHETFIAKDSDYAGDVPYANFHVTERIHLPAFAGAFVRLCDKITRVQTLVKKQRSGIGPAVSETVHDTLLDLANYCLIILVLLDEFRKREGANGWFRIEVTA